METRGQNKVKIVKRKTTFKIGELVELKSGSPKMTVTEITAQDKVRCSWFVGSKHNTAVFPSKSLQVPGADPQIARMHEALKKAFSEHDKVEKPALNAPPKS